MICRYSRKAISVRSICAGRHAPRRKHRCELQVQKGIRKVKTRTHKLVLQTARRYHFASKATVAASRQSDTMGQKETFTTVISCAVGITCLPFGSWSDTSHGIRYTLPIRLEIAR